MNKKFGDRKDGAKLRNIHAMHLVMPLMYPNRCDNEAFISERIDLTNVLHYLEAKNAGNPEYKYNLFQVMVTVMLKTITLRPRMNYFIANKNNPNKKPSGLAARLEALQKQQEEIMKRQQQARNRS